jgi:hypothetical protein
MAVITCCSQDIVDFVTDSKAEFYYISDSTIGTWNSCNFTTLVPAIPYKSLVSHLCDKCIENIERGDWGTE